MIVSAWEKEECYEEIALANHYQHSFTLIPDPDPVTLDEYLPLDPGWPVHPQSITPSPTENDHREHPHPALSQPGNSSIRIRWSA